MFQPCVGKCSLPCHYQAPTRNTYMQQPLATNYITGLWQMLNTPIVRFVPILFNSSHCSPYS